MKKIYTVIILIFLYHQAGFSQTKATVSLEKSSILTIHGSTNLLTFKLIQGGDKIMNKPLELTATRQANKYMLSKNKLSITVENFKSDNIIAQAEFYKLMQTQKYPTLKIQLNHFESETTDNPAQFTKGNALLSFTITGVTKQYLFPVSISTKGNLVTVTGRKRMTIKDFGLVPPVAMLGIVRVSEWIEIDLKIICKVELTEG